jgi:Tfp pilus assembly protein PilF
MRALLLADVGKLDEAVKDLQKVADAAEQDPVPRLQLAMLQFSRKEMQSAIDEFTKVLELDSEIWLALQGRADAYLALGKQAEALADYDAGVKLQPKNSSILNNLAWLLATSPDEKLRDGKRAIDLATEACEVTEYKLPHILSTLAAGYAETGDFETAKQWSTKAIELSDDKIRDALQKELESYQVGKAWRELQNEATEPPSEDPQKTSDKPADSPSDQQTSTADKREVSDTPQ